MSTFSRNTQLDRLLAEAERQHQGPPLWRLSAEQRNRYDQWQAIQSSDYTAYLAGTLGPQAPIPSDIAAVLGLDVVAPTIPTHATEQEASQIYSEYLKL